MQRFLCLGLMGHLLPLGRMYAGGDRVRRVRQLRLTIAHVLCKRSVVAVGGVREPGRVHDGPDRLGALRQLRAKEPHV